MTVTAKGYNGTITFDGRMVTIERTGMGRVAFGASEKQIPVRTISAVQWKAPTWYEPRGFIAFTIPGGTESQSRAHSQVTDAAHDENAVVVRGKKQSEQFTELKRAVEDALATL